MQAADHAVAAGPSTAQQPPDKRVHAANPQHPHHHYTMEQRTAMVFAAAMALNKQGYAGGVPVGMHTDQQFPQDCIDTKEALRQLQQLAQKGVLQGLHHPDSWLNLHNASRASGR